MEALGGCIAVVMVLLVVVAVWCLVMLAFTL